MNERWQRVSLGCTLSLLLHGLLLWLWPEQRISLRPSSLSMEVVLRPLPAAILSEPILPIEEPEPERKERPAPKTKSTNRHPVPTAVLPSQVISEPKEAMPVEEKEVPAVPEASLSERALAGVKAADRTIRAEQSGRQELLGMPAQHRNLVKLSPALQTALARSFENELAELVVLEKTETQEGSDRVTKIRTNKGTYCMREMLVKPTYLRGMPTVPRFGHCGP
ncbi:hypothetical protein ACUHMQ_12480 [Chitinimonas sp. PSY-7]|uniref:hypothetical protein n=1 Tax=Chitinimonas sp. PSY-7 TaxID=3459088 RepID=UPI0040403724